MYAYVCCGAFASAIFWFTVTSFTDPGIIPRGARPRGRDAQTFQTAAPCRTALCRLSARVRRRVCRPSLPGEPKPRRHQPALSGASPQLSPSARRAEARWERGGAAHVQGPEHRRDRLRDVVPDLSRLPAAAREPLLRLRQLCARLRPPLPLHTKLHRSAPRPPTARLRARPRLPSALSASRYCAVGLSSLHVLPLYRRAFGLSPPRARSAVQALATTARS